MFKKSSILSLVGATMVTALALTPACKRFSGCEETGTCSSDGGASTGGKGSAGSSSGGANLGGGGSSSTGGTGTGGTANPCDACSGATPLCNSSKECVECLKTSDCKDAAKSICDTATGTCGKCTKDADCSRFADAPVCDEKSGSCVECTVDTEAARCGEFTCSSLTNKCTTKKPGLLDACDACESDSQCATGRKCVMHKFGAAQTEVGYFCFLEKGSTGCGDTVDARRPYRTSVDATSLDGATAATYCLPPSKTTCIGIKDTQNKSCATDAECGVVGLDDGFCPTTGTGAGSCSYLCGGGFDCNSALTCGGSPQHCRP